MCIYICYPPEPTSKPLVVLSKLRCESIQNISLIYHNRAKQDKHAKYCLLRLLRPKPTQTKINMQSIASYSLSTTTPTHSKEDKHAKY